MTDKVATVYRHNLSDEIMKSLYDFSKIHQFDNRTDYKEAWTSYMEENENMINVEARRLKDQGFEGDVREKMYKSGRYYFRKKMDHGDRKKETTARKKYISLDHKFLQLMDDHILRDTVSSKPAISFESFCILYESEINQEEVRLFEEYNMNVEDFNKKIKKTYKNRCFQNNSKI